MGLIESVLCSCSVPNITMPATIVVCTHAKFSAVELCKSLITAGFNVIFHPVDYSKEAGNIDALLELGITVVEDQKKLIPFIKEADVAIEDGARVSKIVQTHKVSVKKNFFSVEQTSGGVRYFEEHPPEYPVINVAMSPMKLDIENRRATPEGVIRYFSEATGMLLGGKEVFILGFGSIGQGIARLAQTLGAHVTIYDTFATKRMFARHHGYATVEKEDFNHILPRQDVIFMATNTYQGTALSAEQLLHMKDGSILCNAGSGRGELAPNLQEPGKYRIHDAELEITENNGHLVATFSKGTLHKTITVLGKAFPINLHLGQGTSHDAIEVVMSLLLLAALQGPESPEPGLQPLDAEIQECVAQTFLRQHHSDRFFEPRHIRTEAIEVREKPYGGIFPFHNELNDIANLSVARAWFKPATKTRGHYHQRSQESYFAEKGSATILLWPAGDSEKVSTYAMQPGDYLIVPENYYHDVQVTSDEDFECLVIATPPFTVWDQFFNKEMELAV
jgi:S-adenosylhomocysteine hydrolase/mannose-6-phosphate isomerase-like protein (cupin superfamily)